MKKSFAKAILLSGLVLFAFSGCSKGWEDVDPVTKNPKKFEKVRFAYSKSVQTIDVESDKDIYAFKFNTSVNVVVPKGESGYIKSAKKRSAVDEDIFDEEFADEETLEDLYTQDEIDFGRNKFSGELKVAQSRDDFIQANMKNVRAAAGEMIENLEIQKENYKVGDKKYFNVIVGAGPNTTTRKEAELKAVGKNCYVWFINNSPAYMTESDFNDDNKDNMCSFKTLADKFDTIIELEESIDGAHTYTSKASAQFIDSFEKISIVLADLDGDAPHKGSYVTGYFHPVDFNVIDYYDDVHTNCGEIIYIDAYAYKTDATYVYSVLVHEYNHLLNYVRKIVTNDNPSVKWTSWYTEMLSMLCEDLFQDYLKLSDSDVSKQRLYYFNRGYNRGFYNWDTDDLDEKVYFSYPNTYAFGAYLVRNYGGVELMKELATNNAVGFDAIDQAFEAVGATRYDNDEIADFNYAFINEPFILLNCDADGKYDNKISLNKWAGSADDVLHFSPIVLKDFVTEFYDGTFSSSPRIYTANAKGCVELGKKGFSINHIGTGIKEFKVTVPSDYKCVEWYLAEY